MFHHLSYICNWKTCLHFFECIFFKVAWIVHSHSILYFIETVGHHYTINHYLLAFVHERMCVSVYVCEFKSVKEKEGEEGTEREGRVWMHCYIIELFGRHTLSSQQLCKRQHSQHQQWNRIWTSFQQQCDESLLAAWGRSGLFGTDPNLTNPHKDQWLFQ